MTWENPRKFGSLDEFGVELFSGIIPQIEINFELPFQEDRFQVSQWIATQHVALSFRHTLFLSRKITPFSYIQIQNILAIGILNLNGGWESRLTQKVNNSISEELNVLNSEFRLRKSYYISARIAMPVFIVNKKYPILVGVAAGFKNSEYEFSYALKYRQMYVSGPEATVLYEYQTLRKKDKIQFKKMVIEPLIQVTARAKKIKPTLAVGFNFVSFGIIY